MKGILTITFAMLTLLTSSCSDKEPLDLLVNEYPKTALHAEAKGSGTTMLFNCSFDSPAALNQWSQLVKPLEQSVYLMGQYPEHLRGTARFELDKRNAAAERLRAQLVMDHENTLRVERWYGMRTFVPDFIKTDKQADIVAEWEASPDQDLGEGARSAPLSLQVVNGRWFLVVKTSKAQRNTDAAATKQILDLGEFTKNTWVNWAFHFKFSFENDGLIEVYKDGRLVYTWYGPNAYNDKTGLAFKAGLSKPSWATADGAAASPYQRVVYLDDIRVGNENASLKDIAVESVPAL